MNTLKLKPNYLVLVGDEQNPKFAKTGLGLTQWRPDLVAGQLRFAGSKIDLGVPDMSIEEAIRNNIGSLVIGVAPIGGKIPDNWWDVIEEAAEAGIDIVSGLHSNLDDNPKLVKIAHASGAELINVRVPQENIPIGSGLKRSGMRLLTVGTDCASGKKYTALSLDKAMRSNGLNSTFRATGQTGIMIAGEGIPVDAVKADFITGASELLSPENNKGHWDIIEGQGSLCHPIYAPVSLGLLQGSQPDAFVVCHDASRKGILGWEHTPLPSVQECIDLHLLIGKRSNPDVRCVGISVNSSGLSAETRALYLDDLKNETGLPCIDPLITGCDAIVQYLINN